MYPPAPPSSPSPPPPLLTVWRLLLLVTLLPEACCCRLRPPSVCSSSDISSSTGLGTQRKVFIHPLPLTWGEGEGGRRGGEARVDRHPEKVFITLLKTGKVSHLR